MSEKSSVIFKIVGPHAPFFGLLDLFGRASRSYGAAVHRNPGDVHTELEAMRDARENIVDAMTSDLGPEPVGECVEPESIALEGDSSLRKLDRGWSFFRDEEMMRHLSVFEEEHILAAYRAGHAARRAEAVPA